MSKLNPTTPDVQSSKNFTNLMLKNTDPSIMTIDVTANEQAAAERRKAQDAAHPVDSRKELARGTRTA